MHFLLRLPPNAHILPLWVVTEHQAELSVSNLLTDGRGRAGWGSEADFISVSSKLFYLREK